MLVTDKMPNRSLSIALCTYNGEKYLQEQLDSIIVQTRKPDEVIVCDDRSADNTLKILENFKQTAPFNVQIYINEKNLGPTKNFEKAISLCRGDIIALSDQDDLWVPDKLEKLEYALNLNPQAGYVFSNALIVDENLHPLGYTMWDRIKFFPKDRKRFKNGYQTEILLKRNIVTGATMAFRAELAKVILPIPQKWLHDAWIAIFLSSLGAKGIFIEECLISYRQHSKQVVGGKYPSLKTKCQVAFKNQTCEYNEAVKKFEELHARLGETSLSKSIINNLNLIANKINFLRNRAKLYRKKTNLFEKMKILGNILLKREYFKYSNDFVSIVKDLVILFIKAS